MANFIHGPDHKHDPVDLEQVASIKIRFAFSSNYQSELEFFSKKGKRLSNWKFKYKEKELATEIFEKIKKEIGSKNIIDSISL